MMNPKYFLFLFDCTLTLINISIYNFSNRENFYFK